MWFVLRVLGLLCLASGAVAALHDGTRTVATEQIVTTPLGQTWVRFDAASLDGAEAFVKDTLPGTVSMVIWDIATVAILQMPTFAVLALVGILLLLIGRRRKRRREVLSFTCSRAGDMDIAGLSAIVTGGASGLGAAVVRRLRATGARVAVIDLDLDRAKALVDEVGGSAHAADVSDPEALLAAFYEARSAQGQERIVVTCAAINRSRPVVGPQGEPHDMRAFARTVSANLNGTFQAASLGAAGMAALDPIGQDGLRGVIVQTASVAGLEGRAGQIAYAASKAGVVGMTLPLARELGPLGIRVMTIAPGPFETPMLANVAPERIDGMVTQAAFPRRLGRPREFADMVVAVIENDMLNGSIVRLDGGIRMGLSTPA